jgi:hypothetical protein
MWYPKRQQLITNFQGTVGLGNTVSFDITRDFFLDSLLVFQPITITSATAADLTPEGLWNAIKQILLPVADGQSNRIQTNVSGPGALRYYGKVGNALDYKTIQASTVFIKETALSLAGGVTFLICYPITFKHPQLSDPIGSYFMLPLPRYNADPQLQLTYGSLSDITSDPDAMVTLGNPYVVVNKRDVPNIQFPTFQTELIENVQAFGSTGANQLYNLQVPGTYTNIELYMKNASNVATDITNNQVNTLGYLGQTLRYFIYNGVKVEEQYSQGNDAFITDGSGIYDIFPGLISLDFLHDGYGMEVGELNSAFNLNPLAGSGAQGQINLNIASTGTISVLWHRIFGDLTLLKVPTALANG